MGLKHEVVREFDTMKAGLSNATYNVLKLSIFLATVYYYHCQLTISFFREAPEAFNLANKDSILKFIVQHSFPIAIFYFYIAYHAQCNTPKRDNLCCS